MNIRTQIIIIIALILAIVLLLSMVKKRKIRLKYALPWMLLAVCIAILTCIPVLTSSLAEFFGVELPVNLIFFLGFCFSLVIIFGLTMTVSGLSEKVKRLTQNQGLLEKELKDLKRYLEENE